MTEAEQKRVAAAYSLAEREIMLRGSDTMRAHVRATDVLLDQHPEWSECERTARRRQVLQMWDAESEGPTPAAPVAPDESVAVDLVVPLSAASKAGDDAELRYLLRSAQKHLVGLRKVWILGTHKPRWLTGVEYVEVPDDQPRKSWNILRKFRALLERDTTERIVKASDDTVFLRPIDPARWTVVKGGELRQPEEGKRSSFWSKCQYRTREWLLKRGCSTRNYDTHAPCVLTRDGLARMFERFTEDEWKQGRGWALWSLYYNITPPTIGELCMCKRTKVTFERATKGETVERVRELAKGRLFLGYNNPGLTEHVLAFLEESFPEPSRFELPDELTPEAHAPTRTFTWLRPERVRPVTGLEEVLGSMVHEAPPADVLRAIADRYARPMVLTSAERRREITEALAGTGAVIEVAISDAAVRATCAVAKRRRQLLDAIVLAYPGSGQATREHVEAAHGVPVLDVHDALWMRPETVPALDDASFIVPIRGLESDPDRLASFRFVVARILEAKPLEVIVVEQLSPGQTPMELPDGCTSITVESELDCLHKARLLNAGATVASGRMLWLHDADCWLDWQLLMVRMRGELPPVVKPFGEIWRIGRGASREFMETGAGTFERGAYSKVLCGGSVLVHRDVFMKAGGVDESLVFVPWGGEDNDLGDRLRAVAKCEVWGDSVGVHLYHARDKKALKRAAAERGVYEALRERRSWPLERRIREVVSPFVKRDIGVSGSGYPVLPVARSYEIIHDTVLVMCYYGDAPERREATRLALEQLARLNPLPVIVFGELHNGTQRFRGQVEAIPGARYYAFEERDANRDLMLKESFYNVLARLYHARPAVWIFGDGDFYPVSADWAWRMRAAVLSNPHSIVQGFSRLIDTGEGASKPFYSVSYSRLHDRTGKVWGNPGLVWGMTGDAFDDIGGFNPWAICGAGDALWLWEAMGGCGYRPEVYGLPVYRGVMREPKAYRLGSLGPNETLVHCNHGPYSPTRDGRPGRGYRYRWRLIQHWGDDAIRDHVELDDRGLLEWKDPSCALRMAIARKGECASDSGVQRVIADVERGVVTLTRRQFCVAQEVDPAYYKAARWDRFQEITAAIRDCPVGAFRKGVFELGPYRTPLVQPSDTMDIDGHVGATFCQDATSTPWPIASDSYSLAIASHVLEHLGASKPAVIAELARIAEWVLIALPYLWTDRGAPEHCDIDSDVLDGWVASSGAAIERVSLNVYPVAYGQLVAVYRRVGSVA